MFPLLDLIGNVLIVEVFVVAFCIVAFCMVAYLVVAFRLAFCTGTQDKCLEFCYNYSRG